MGIISNLVLELVAYPSSCDIMKFWLLTIALVASAIAEPEGEATPKADPKSWYGTYGLGYGTLGYGGYGGLGYGYGHYLGKRSAEAETDPKADPKSWYGTYGLGYGTLGYGGYGGLA